VSQFESLVDFIEGVTRGLTHQTAARIERGPLVSLE
jgi:hypothetical protein